MVEVKRIEKSIKNERFLNKVYTDREILYCESKKKHAYESFAGRYCAKEAFLKAIGIGIMKGIDFKEIEVITDDGKPKIILGEHAKDYLSCYNKYCIEISISHLDELAIASVIIMID